MKIVVIENLININAGNKHYYSDNYCLKNAGFIQSFHAQNGRWINDGKKQKDMADEVSAHDEAQKEYGGKRTKINRIFMFEGKLSKAQNR